MQQKSTHISLCSTIFILLSVCFTLAAQATVIDKVVAVVNDDIITMSELTSETNKHYRALVKKKGVNAPSIEAVREEALNSLIDRQLIEQKAAQLHIIVSNAEIDNSFEENLAQSGVSREVFLKKMNEAGLSEEMYRNNIRAGILQGKLVSADIQQKIVVTDTMVEAYYHEHYAEHETEKFYNLLQIGCDWSNDTTESKTAKETALARIQEAREAILAGADFAEIARHYSNLPSAEDGGSIGALAATEMAEPMAKIITSLHEGEISSIIETADGYQFFQLIALTNGNNNKIMKEKEEVRRTLYQQKLKEAYKNWVQQLKGDAYIQKIGNLTFPQ